MCTSPITHFLKPFQLTMRAIKKSPSLSWNRLLWRTSDKGIFDKLINFRKMTAAHANFHPTPQSGLKSRNTPAINFCVDNTSRKKNRIYVHANSLIIIMLIWKFCAWRMSRAVNRPESQWNKAEVIAFSGTSICSRRFFRLCPWSAGGHPFPERKEMNDLWVTYQGMAASSQQCPGDEKEEEERACCIVGKHLQNSSNFLDSQDD